MANSPSESASRHSHKKILIAVSGSIAAYKIADVVSTLKKQGHEVRCLMTESASQFVTPLVLETLSGNPVHTALFGPEVSGTEHIRLARWPDVVLFAPATAHLLAKLALGLADDLITTVALATRAPILIAPAMNTVMWEHPATRANLETLQNRGARVIEPADGTLACGEEGAGKLASPETLVESVLALASEAPQIGTQDLTGLRVLITAGPTTSAIDAVRYLTNHSTGRMGAALADEAVARGAEVFYVLGVDKGVVRPKAHSRLHLTEVGTATEMLEASLKHLPQVDGVIATAAVLDYQVAKPAPEKTKRGTAPVTLELVPSVDVLTELRSHASEGQWFVGFAAETSEIEIKGTEKLRKKGLDYLFANRVAKLGESLETGFAAATNAGVLIKRHGDPVPLSLTSKSEIARGIWNALLQDKKQNPRAFDGD